VDGACPGNGTNHAVKSACGVYFGPLNGPDTTYGQTNLAWRIPDKPGYRHTSQRAELHAALGALAAAKRYVVNGGQWLCSRCSWDGPVNRVVIKSDSAYLVNSMGLYLQNWVSNGWRTATNAPVKNRHLWEDMMDQVTDLEDWGAVVQFWHVRRERNREADELANIGLEEDV
jgi:ribonuclease HI